ncbi:VOC family protein [Saccharomonospora amisosensis]|uniref:Lactoylglutathione lyase family protein n=1 Tax=Saccharomonospora marina XMU15 TaxID=882083 RepID=H5X729_9PSEU|nr:VOC family protein [Saccharomonospora amisosensis]EHR53497.1 lactoylglutathione lyase family protein [Saccharomonospora marina XMU15]
MSDSKCDLRSILLPASDLESSLAFYRDGLGLGVRMRDRDDYAELSAGSIKLALAIPADHPVPESALPVFRSEDVSVAVSRLLAAGATVLSGPVEGAHEIRAVLRDPSGNPFVVYRSRA